MELSKDERLAALLDGRCSEEERRAILAELAAGGEDLEVFADAADILREMEEEDRRIDVIPIAPVHPVVSQPSRKWWRPPRRVSLAAAAVIAGLAAIPLIQQLSGPGTLGPAEIVAQLTDTRSGIPPGLEVPQGENRGEVKVLEAGDKVRLGAYLATLQLSAGNDSSAKNVAFQIDSLLRYVPGAGDSLRASYKRIAGTGLQGRAPDPGLSERVAKLAGRDVLLGAWLQTARVAAAHNDSTFFDTDFAGEIIAGKGAGTRLDATSPDVRKELGEALRSAPPNWDRISDILRRLLETAAI
jgi:hypothetical protein